MNRMCLILKCSLADLRNIYSPNKHCATSCPEPAVCVSLMRGGVLRGKQQ